MYDFACLTTSAATRTSTWRATATFCEKRESRVLKIRGKCNAWWYTVVSILGLHVDCSASSNAVLRGAPGVLTLSTSVTSASAYKTRTSTCRRISRATAAFVERSGRESYTLHT